MEMNVDKELFQPVKQDEKALNVIVRPSETFWQDAWRRLKMNKVAMVALTAMIILILLAIFGPFLSKFDYRTNDPNHADMFPNAVHWFGTDDLGRDLLVRVLYGMRISLSVGFVCALINLIIGVIYGGIAGYYGGKVDNIMMRIVDILFSVPYVLYVILIMCILGGGLLNIFVAIGITSWLNMARIVRGQVLALKEQEFILAAKALGADNMRIIIRHLIPNCLGPIIVCVAWAIPDAIFAEAFLSFIGLGVSAPMASLGVLANDAVNSLTIYPYMLLFPSLAICCIMLAFNLFGDGLRDALDPKMRK